MLLANPKGLRTARSGKDKMRLWLLGICWLTIIIGGAFFAYRGWSLSSKSPRECSGQSSAPAALWLHPLCLKFPCGIFSFLL